MSQEIQITVLGTGSATPTKLRHPSGQFVRFGGDYILLDCGEGTLRQMDKFGLRWHRLKIVCISHLHGDHFYGLPGLLTTLSLHGRKDKLILVGPTALKRYLDLTLSLGDAELQYTLEYVFTDVSPPGIVFEGDHCSINTMLLNHRIFTTGFLITEKRTPRKLDIGACERNKVPVTFYEQLKQGFDFKSEEGETIPNSILTTAASEPKKYAYVSDSTMHLPILDVIKGVDLLYHESTFLEVLKDRAIDTFHSTAKQAGQMAKLASVKKLMIGHFSARYHETEPLLKEAMSEFANTILAVEGETLKL